MSNLLDKRGLNSIIKLVGRVSTNNNYNTNEEDFTKINKTELVAAMS